MSLSTATALSRACRPIVGTTNTIAAPRLKPVTRTQVASARGRCLGLYSRTSQYPLSLRAHPLTNKSGYPTHSVYVGSRRRASSKIGDGDGNERRSDWENLGVSSSIIERLHIHYPHIHTPTLAQKAFILSLTGERDIFLRDGMGRGKTFALALASLILASRSERAERVLILAPSVQLVEQIKTHLTNLSPEILDDEMIQISTPQNITRMGDDPARTGWSCVMIDEPESMLAPLPSRHLPPAALRSHPFNRHPPPLATFLDQLRDSDPQGRKGPRMIYVGAELNSLLKRVIRQRGWTGMDSLELDFGSGPSGRAKKDIEATLGHLPSGDRDSTGRTTGSKPPTSIRTGVKHTAMVIGPDGRFVEYIPNSILGATTTLPDYRSGRPDIDQTIIEAIMALEIEVEDQLPISSDTKRTTTSLILPPEGYPLDLLAAQIQATANSLNSSLTCSVLDPSSSSTSTSINSIPSNDSDVYKTSSPSTSLVIAPRSSIAGLDIPNLGRIYLINALDLAGLSPSQRARGGLKRRLGWYDTVQGRLGRLGSRTEKGGGEVISLVTRGSGEEVGLDAILSTRHSLGVE